MPKRQQVVEPGARNKFIDKWFGACSGPCRKPIPQFHQPSPAAAVVLLLLSPKGDAQGGLPVVATAADPLPDRGL